MAQFEYTKEMIYTEFKEATVKDEKSKKPSYKHRVAMLKDMIALKDSEVTLIDVKTFCLKLDRKSSSFSTGIGLVPSNPRTEEQKKLGVKILGFNPETRELKFVEHPNETENKKS